MGPNEAGELLRRARLAAGLSQAEVARRGAVPQSVISAYETGKREPALRTLRRLVEATGQHLMIDLRAGRALPDSPGGRLLTTHRAALQNVLARYGASGVRVFGSVARGEDTPNSDIDLLVDLPDGTSLLGLIALRRELTEILGQQVDVVPGRALRAEVRAAAERDAVSL